jgi:hypothetical protein
MFYGTNIPGEKFNSSLALYNSLNEFTTPGPSAYVAFKQTWHWIRLHSYNIICPGFVVHNTRIRFLNSTNLTYSPNFSHYLRFVVLTAVVWMILFYGICCRVVWCMNDTVLRNMTSCSVIYFHELFWRISFFNIHDRNLRKLYFLDRMYSTLKMKTVISFKMLVCITIQHYATSEKTSVLGNRNCKITS